MVNIVIRILHNRRHRTILPAQYLQYLHFENAVQIIHSQFTLPVESLALVLSLDPQLGFLLVSFVGTDLGYELDQGGLTQERSHTLVLRHVQSSVWTPQSDQHLT